MSSAPLRRTVAVATLPIPRALMFSEAYRQSARGIPGSRDSQRCPIEAGLFGMLADNECEHGNLPSRRHPFPACACWPVAA